MNQKSSAFCKVLLASGILCNMIPVHAQNVLVPNIFSAGTPARASEINANFKSLADAINKVSGQVSGSPINNLGVSYCPWTSTLALKYSPSNQPINSSIGRFKLGLIPVIDITNGDKYVLHAPFPVAGPIAGADIPPQVTVEGAVENDSSTCKPNISINGFPAYLAASEVYRFEPTLGASSQANAYIIIYFGGSKLTLLITFTTGTQPTQTLVPSKGYIPAYAWSGVDYTLNFPWQNVSLLPVKVVPQLQELVNSVHFRKLN